MIVNVRAQRDGQSYNFAGVEVNSIDELRANYGAAGITILGYDVISGSTPTPISNPTADQIRASIMQPINTGGSPIPVQQTTSSTVVSGNPNSGSMLLLIAAAVAAYYFLR